MTNEEKNRLHVKTTLKRLEEFYKDENTDLTDLPEELRGFVLDGDEISLANLRLIKRVKDLIRSDAKEGLPEHGYKPTMDDYRLCVYNMILKMLKEKAADRKAGRKMIDDMDCVQTYTLLSLGEKLNRIRLDEDNDLADENTNALAELTYFLEHDAEVMFGEDE